MYYGTPDSRHKIHLFIQCWSKGVTLSQNYSLYPMRKLMWPKNIVYVWCEISSIFFDPTSTKPLPMHFSLHSTSRWMHKLEFGRVGYQSTMAAFDIGPFIFLSQSAMFSQKIDFNLKKMMWPKKRGYDEHFHPFFVLICTLSLLVNSRFTSNVNV